MGTLLVAVKTGGCVTRWQRVHDLPGVVLRDLYRYQSAFAHSGGGFRSDANGWISLCNRIESLTAASGEPGVRCNWVWGSELHATRVLPWLARRLMHLSLTEWPILFHDEPRVIAERPRISFIFAHGGSERLTQLRRVIRSIFAQQEVPCEVVVVDQTSHALLPALPPAVTYRHLAKDGVAPGWHKAWAYNLGARLARGDVLVFHDGDICVPERYAIEILAAIDTRNHAAASLQRFLFYLTARATRGLEEQDPPMLEGLEPDVVSQNWKGGTIAIHRDAFTAIGGFDEGFVDWGGEDDEFYDRCLSVGHCRSGYLPFVHLWHPPQPARRESTNPNVADILPWRLGLARTARVGELAQRQFGHDCQPDPAVSYKAQRSA